MAFPSGYTKYQEVTIQSSQVTADLTDYPVYIDLSDMVKAGADIFDTCRTDGGDIRITKTDGTTELAREVVTIDTTAKTGQIHVKFTGTLSSSSNTVIRVWYNGTDTEPATSATYGRDNVWSDYEAVLHMENATTDSTGNGDWTNTGASNDTGKIAGGQLTDGSSDYISSTRASLDDIDGSDFTIQGWALPQQDASGYLFMKGNQSSNWIGTFNDSGNGRYGWNVDNGSSNSFVYNTSNTFDNGDTTYYMWTRSGTSGRIYINDLTASTVTHHTNENTGTDPFFIGCRNIGGAQSAFNDAIYDEFRIRFSALSQDWRDTEYVNQNVPSTFYSVGDEEGGGGGVSSILSVSGVTQVNIKSIAGVTNANIKSIAGVSNT